MIHTLIHTLIHTDILSFILLSRAIARSLKTLQFERARWLKRDLSDLAISIQFSHLNFTFSSHLYVFIMEIRSARTLLCSGKRDSFLPIARLTNCNLGMSSANVKVRQRLLISKLNCINYYGHPLFVSVGLSGI